MKLALVAILIAISLGLLCLAQSPRPMPDGLRHAQELNASLPVPASRSSFDAAALRRDAEDLAKLAASVPPDIQNAGKGLLSKDLIQKLKQIEKLSKHLRSELDR